MAHWAEVLPQTALLEVRYEDLVGDTDREARRILAHIGLDPPRGPLNFHRTERRIRTASALQARQPVYGASVGRWRRYEAFLGPLLEGLAISGSR